MKDLTALTTEELQKELARRNRQKVPVPQRVEKPDWSMLSALCRDYIASVDFDDVDKNMEHYIFEAAVEAVYGKKIWDWVNARL